MVSLSTPKSPSVTQGSPGVVWLVLGPHHRDSHTQGSRCGGRATKDDFGSPRVVKLLMGLHHQICKKVKFMMELHHGNPKECEASIGASTYGLPHLCESVNGWLYKWS